MTLIEFGLFENETVKVGNQIIITKEHPNLPYLELGDVLIVSSVDKYDVIATVYNKQPIGVAYKVFNGMYEISETLIEEFVTERKGIDGKTYKTVSREIKEGDRIFIAHHHNHSDVGDTGTVTEISEIFGTLFYKSDATGKVALNIPTQCELII